MRRSTTILAIGLLTSSLTAPAFAATTGRVCRHACGPRILEQCGELAGSEFRRCRRPLVQACKATTPEVACATTADLTRALNDRLLDPTPDSTLRLCGDGTFLLTEPAGAAVPETRTRGDWRVELVDGALSVVLDVNGASLRQLKIQPDGAGGFVVDGTPTAATDAAAACAPPVGERAPDPVLDLRDPEQVSATARAITDRTLSRSTFDAAGSPEIQAITLCSSGTLRAVKVPITLQPEFDQGTWSIDETGTEIALVLEQGLLPASFDVTTFEDGRVFLNGEPAEVRDARGTCTDVDLESRFAALLTASAYTFTITAGNFTIQSTLVLCTPDRFVRRNGFSVPSSGRWSVEATDGVAVLRTVDGVSGIAGDLPLTLADDGTLLVDGVPPVADPAALIPVSCA